MLSSNPTPQPDPDQQSNLNPESNLTPAAPAHPEEGTLPPAPTATLRADITFEFLSGGQILAVEGQTVVAAQHFSRPGRCRLRVFDLPSLDLPNDDSTPNVLVIATDLDEENPGMSVTNAAEDIASQACLRFGLDPARTLFVEHYDDRFRGVLRGQLVETGSGIGRERGESFDWVSFPQRQGMNFGEPAWKHGTKSQVETLIGQRLV